MIAKSIEDKWKHFSCLKHGVENSFLVQIRNAKSISQNSHAIEFRSSQSPNTSGETKIFKASVGSVPGHGRSTYVEGGDRLVEVELQTPSVQLCGDGHAGLGVEAAVPVAGHF